MCSVRSQNNPPDHHLGSQSLMYLVGAEIRDPVLLGRGVSREHVCEFARLPLTILFQSQPCNLAVAYPPHAIALDLGGHVVVLWMYYEVCMVPTVFLKVVISLPSVL
jgi:hypothetical protein